MFDRGEDRSPVLDDRFLQLHERGNPATAGPTNPFVEGFDRFIDREFEDDAQAFFQVVGPAEGGIGLHDPGELHRLLLGEVFRVLPERVTGVLHPGRTGTIRAGPCIRGRPTTTSFCLVAACRFPGVVPCGPSHLIEGFGGPFDNMERVSAAHRVRAAFGHNGGDPRGPVRGNMRDLGRAFRPERVEEAAQGGLVLPGVAQTKRPLSWSTITVKYLCPRL